VPHRPAPLSWHMRPLRLLQVPARVRAKENAPVSPAAPEARVRGTTPVLAPPRGGALCGPARKNAAIGVSRGNGRVAGLANSALRAAHKAGSGLTPRASAHRLSPYPALSWRDLPGFGSFIATRITRLSSQAKQKRQAPNQWNLPLGSFLPTVWRHYRRPAPLGPDAPLGSLSAPEP
jgi:hypothetical protein